MSYNVILFSLDAILDTRLQLLFKKDSVKALEAYFNNHKTRVSDGYSWYPYNDFKKDYSNRNEEILHRSQPTNMFNLIDHIMLHQVNDKVYNPSLPSLKLCVNTHPYKVSDNEIIALEAVISANIDQDVEIYFTSVSLDDITPKFLKHNGVKCFIEYEFDLWLHKMAKYFSKTESETDLVPEVTLLCPMLINKPEEEKGIKDLELLEKQLHYEHQNNKNIKEPEDLTPISLYELIYRPFININFVDVVHFNAMLDPDKIKILLDKPLTASDEAKLISRYAKKTLTDSTDDNLDLGNITITTKEVP